MPHHGVLVTHRIDGLNAYTLKGEPMPIIKPVGAFEDETVEIRWHLRDGTTYYEQHTIPPKATVKERQKAEQTQQEDVRQVLFQKVDAAKETP